VLTLLGAGRRVVAGVRRRSREIIITALFHTENPSNQALFSGGVGALLLSVLNLLGVKRLASDLVSGAGTRVRAIRLECGI
jgi:Na+/H+ antiporter NhaA